jgi:hypothetical protein
MGDAVANVVGALQQEVLALTNQVSVYKETVESQTALVTQLCTTLSTTLQTCVTRQESSTRALNLVLEKLDVLQKNQEHQQIELRQMAQQSLKEFNNNHQQQSTSFDDVAAEDDGIDDAVDGGVMTLREARAAFANNRALDPRQMLLPSPRQPHLLKFPESWVLLVEDWARNDLESFLKVRGKEWKCHTNRLRYVKRSRGIHQLRNFKRNISREASSDMEIAIKLDGEREGRNWTMTKHIDFLHQNDHSIHRRAKKRKANNEANNDSNNNNNAT